MEKKFMYVDDIAVELNGEKNVLEVIRKAGIDMPTLCYHPELSIYGACRMCMFENERGGLDAACSAQPRAVMLSSSLMQWSSSSISTMLYAFATPARRTKSNIADGVKPRRRRPQMVGILGSSQPSTSFSSTSLRR